MRETAAQASSNSNNNNTAVVRGRLTADARVADLADGTSVHNFEVRCGDAVVPVAWYDPRRPPKLVAGTEIIVVGRVRRRWFRAGGGSQSRTEVVADTVARPGSAGAARAVAGASEAVAATVDRKP